MFGAMIGMTRRGRRHGHGRIGDWLFGKGRDRDQGEPFGLRRRFFEAGEVRIALLSLLKDEPKHGYELMKEMEARSGGMYRASAGTVYPNLQMLEDEGLIKADEKEDGKRAYTITAAGKKELEANDEHVASIWRRADRWGGWRDALRPGAEEIAGPAIRLARTAFKASAGASAERAEKIRDVLMRASEEIERIGGED